MPCCTKLNMGKRIGRVLCTDLVIDELLVRMSITTVKSISQDNDIRDLYARLGAKTLKVLKPIRRSHPLKKDLSEQPVTQIKITYLSPVPSKRRTKVR